MGKLLDLIPAEWRILALIVLLASVGLAGWTARGWKEDAVRLESERAAQETYRKTVEGWAAAAQVITESREQERQKSAADRRAWQKEIDDAKRSGSLVVCGAGMGSHEASGADGVAARLSGGFVRLWNDALAIGLPDTLRPWRADGAGAQADPAGVAPEDALDNLAANAEQCNDLRGQVLAWQAWARKIGAAR